MNYPKMLYKHPGAHALHGSSFDYIIVDSESDEANAVADGWCQTTDDARYGAISNDSATRAELEQKATELGIKFDGRTSDKKLAEKIEEALNGMDQASTDSASV